MDVYRTHIQLSNSTSSLKTIKFSYGSTLDAKYRSKIVSDNFNRNKKLNYLKKLKLY